MWAIYQWVDYWNMNVFQPQTLCLKSDLSLFGFKMSFQSIEQQSICVFAAVNWVWWLYQPWIWALCSDTTCRSRDDRWSHGCNISYVRNPSLYRYNHSTTINDTFGVERFTAEAVEQNSLLEKFVKEVSEVFFCVFQVYIFNSWGCLK